MFNLQPHLDQLYKEDRSLSFNAKSLAEFDSWKAELRRELTKLLGLEGRTVPQKVSVQKVSEADRGEYIEEKYTLDVGEPVPAPMYILVPKGKPPFKPIMVFHGHNPSVQFILGNYPDDETAKDRWEANNNYAQVLAQAGYLVCAVEQRGFGERMSDQTQGNGFPTSCRHLSFEYMMQGQTLLGERIWDGMCAMTYVQSREDVVPGVMGCTGNSGGGTTTLWLTALDERITVTVPSCYFCSFKDSILGVYHCECNYVPGVLKLVEMGEIGAMIAPRPFRAIAGEKDHIFPIGATREQFETVKRAYELHGKPEAATLAVHPGGHAYNHEFSREWFDRCL